MAKAAPAMEFEFEDISLDEARELTAVHRQKESKWRKVLDSFVESGREAAVVHVDNGKTAQSQSQSVGAVIRRALENGEVIPVKVRPRDRGLVIIRMTDDEVAKAQADADKVAAEAAA